jgi:hypothetical protein
MPKHPNLGQKTKKMSKTNPDIVVWKQSFHFFHRVFNIQPANLTSGVETKHDSNDSTIHSQQVNKPVES